MSRTTSRRSPTVGRDTAAVRLALFLFYQVGTQSAQAAIARIAIIAVITIAAIIAIVAIIACIAIIACFAITAFIAIIQIGISLAQDIFPDP